MLHNTDTERLLNITAPAQFVAQAIASNDIVVFTTSFGCDSIRTKAFFEQEDFGRIDIKFYDLDTFPQGRALLKVLPGIPSIYIRTQRIGTLNDLELALQNGELEGVLPISQ